MSEPAERGYRNFLSLDAIVAEARAIADLEGLGAVSMRGLADRLGCTPRALYRHVSDKDEVLELLADRALGEVPFAVSSTDWQAALLEFFTGMYDLFVASPAVAAIVSQHAVAGSQFQAHASQLVVRLLAEDIPPDTAVDAVVTLAQFTLGASLPGTGQKLHDTYRSRRPELVSETSSALTHVARYFATDDARARFVTALRRMIRAYD